MKTILTADFFTFIFVNKCACIIKVFTLVNDLLWSSGIAAVGIISLLQFSVLIGNGITDIA